MYCVMIISVTLLCPAQRIKVSVISENRERGEVCLLPRTINKMKRFSLAFIGTGFQRSLVVLNMPKTPQSCEIPGKERRVSRKVPQKSFS